MATMTLRLRILLVLFAALGSVGGSCMVPPPEDVTPQEGGPQRPGNPNPGGYLQFAPESMRSPSLSLTDITSLDVDLKRYAQTIWGNAAEIEYNGQRQYQATLPACDIGVITGLSTTLSVTPIPGAGSGFPLRPDKIFVYTDTGVAGAGAHFTDPEIVDLIAYNPLIVRPAIMYWPRLYIWHEKTASEFEIKGGAALGPHLSPDGHGPAGEGMIWIAYHWAAVDPTNMILRHHLLAHEMLHLISRVIHDHPSELLGNDLSWDDYLPFMGIHQYPYQEALSWNGSLTPPVVSPTAWSLRILTPIKVQGATGSRSQCGEMRTDPENYAR